MTVLWVGHEAECYVLGNSHSIENNAVADAGYERTGMEVGESGGGGDLYSTPDWTPVDEFWQRWNDREENCSVGMTLWAALNVSGTQLARITTVTTTTGQFQVWDGSSWVNVGAAFTLVTGFGTKARWDLHIKGGNPGQVELYYGTPGSQVKVVDTTGDYSAVVNMVRIYHGATAAGPGTNHSYVAHEIVQTTSTLSSTSEVHPPTGDGTDTDGGVGGWANVDETPYNDADYIVLAASGKKQSFTTVARSLTQAVVTGVTASCRAWYEAGGHHR